MLAMKPNPVLLFLVPLLFVAGCGTTQASPSQPRAATCDDIGRLLELKPSEMEDIRAGTKGACLSQDLRFSGELTGVAKEAILLLGNDTPCPRPGRGARMPFANLNISFGDKLYLLNIGSLADYGTKTAYDHRAKSLELVPPKKRVPEGGLDFGAGLHLAGRQVGISEPPEEWESIKGKLTYDQSGISGLVDATLMRDVTGAVPVHLKGRWRCNEPKLAPSPDPSLAALVGKPCSTLYLAAGTEAATADQLNAEGDCSKEDLNFSGDVTGHVSEGVNRRSEAARPFGSAEDVCASDLYGRHFAFAIGEETFRLTINPGAGQHSGDYGPVNLIDSSHPPTLTLDYDPLDFPARDLTGPIDRVQWTSTDGAVHIAGDDASGTIEMQLKGGVPGNATVHLSGSWRCALTA